MQYCKEEQMQRLPIGVQSFEKLRRSGDLYIDKTTYISRMLEEGTVYFLSRPRRFGKSLLLSTMESYFEGKKELFRGLAISSVEEQKPEPWISYPVIHFNLSGGQFDKEDGLRQMLEFSLSVAMDRYGISKDEIQGEMISVRFKSLIMKLAEQIGRPVVVLVDEYDKPLLMNMAERPDLEEENRSLLKAFFGVLKDADSFLHFVFMTGVTKFSQVSIFSDLNQLRDISMLPRYAAICGITEEEISECLLPEIAAMAADQGLSIQSCMDRLKENYDGYHFSFAGPGVYNPFSLFNALTDHLYGSYWYESGTPTFLISCIRESGILVKDFSDGISATSDEMTEYRTGDDNVIPLFYQSGYLTITGYDKTFNEYQLGFPNAEVKYGFFRSLLPSLKPQYSGAGRFSASRMVRFLQDGDVDAFMTMIQALLGSIPYYEGKAPQNEQQWRNLVYVIFSLLGQYVSAEVHSSDGRSDFVVENADYVYLFEFKEDKTAQDALDQIEKNGYIVPYLSSGKRIVKIGANFSSGKKTLDEWKVE